jgi:hypothetical protein
MTWIKSNMPARIISTDATMSRSSPVESRFRDVIGTG